MLKRSGNAPRSRLQPADLFREAAAGVLSRPTRAALTAAGTVLGVATLVATVGLSRTAGEQIVTRFDALSATGIEAVARTSDGKALMQMPWDAEARLGRLNGVRFAGTISEVDRRGALTGTLLPGDGAGPGRFELPVVALSPGAFGAVRATTQSGRFFDGSHEDLDVAVVGSAAASDLGLYQTTNGPAIFVGDRPFVVIGIVGDVKRHAELLDAVMIPEGTARRLFGLAAPHAVQVDTRIGAAKLIARQAPIALAPDHPELVRITAPVEPKAVKAKVEDDLSALLILLGTVSLLVGALGIANVTLVSVLERVGEIGLRRAIGASRRHIAAQFLLESFLLGLFGGLLGMCLGTVVTVAVSAAQQWTPVIDPLVPILSPLGGGLVGLLSGAYPSIRAATMEPVVALRGAP